jgi:hypothetical protein
MEKLPEPFVVLEIETRVKEKTPFVVVALQEVSRQLGMLKPAVAAVTAAVAWQFVVWATLFCSSVTCLMNPASWCLRHAAIGVLTTAAVRPRA